MASLIIKVSKDGSSREYLFNKLGPILIGSDEKSDIRLEGTQLEPRLLEVKLSSGNIYIKELGVGAEVFLDTAILPYREETLYRQGETISIAGSHYQLQIFKVGEEAIEPPPFFTDEYKVQLEELKRKIKDKEDQLNIAVRTLDKKKSSLEDVDASIQTKLSEKNKRELEIDFLKKKQYEINQELDKKRDQINNEQNTLSSLKDHIAKLGHEDKSLNEAIVRHESTLFRIKGDIERSHLEMKDNKAKLAELSVEEKKKITHLHDLQRDTDEVMAQSASESQKINALLHQTDSSLKEKRKLEIKIEQLKKEMSDSSKSMDQLQSMMSDQQKLKRESEAKLQTVTFEIERCEHHCHKIREDILLEQGKELQLKNLNEELRSELSKIEDKLVSKKNQYNQIDYQTQDALKKLSNLNVEVEKLNYHLHELATEEKSQDLKMMGLRKELDLYIKKMEADKKRANESFEELKINRQQELQNLSKDIDENRLELTLLRNTLQEVQTEHNEFVQNNQALFRDRSEIEVKVEALTHRRMELEKVGSKIKEDNTSLFLEKGRLENEISILKLKQLDCESMIKQKESESFLELENMKRDERARLHSERLVMLSEIEAQKQKSLIEIDSTYRQKEESLKSERDEKFKDVEKLLKVTQEEAAVILSKARQEELTITAAAAKRLNDATFEAIQREQVSHERISDAQIYFKEKEKEAEVIILNSRRMAAEIVRTAEVNLQEDLESRKKRIKNYLTMKQEKVDQHFDAQEKAQILKLKKEQEYELKQIDMIKRKELKRLAKIKNAELERSAAMKAELQKEVKSENEEIHSQIQVLRKRQEDELNETKKTVLEHINQNKMRLQKAFEEEMAREKSLFEQTKRQRVQMASQGVMNLLITRIGSLPEGDLKEQIQNTLEMAINGQNPENHQKMEQSLDYNPMKQKNAFPVIKKFAFRIGLPAAIALTILLDIGSARTGLMNLSAKMMKQSQSASDMFVKKQHAEWKEKYTFKPETTVGYKDTITNNILYTTDYYKVMESEAFQNAWILAVNDFMVKELELSEDLAINYISSEGSAVKDLWAIRKDINPKFQDQSFKKMNEVEQIALGWLKEKVQDQEKMKKFTDFRKKYYDDFYSQQVEVKRDLASGEIIED